MQTADCWNNPDKVPSWKVFLRHFNFKLFVLMIDKDLEGNTTNTSAHGLFLTSRVKTNNLIDFQVGFQHVGYLPINSQRDRFHNESLYLLLPYHVPTNPVSCSLSSRQLSSRVRVACFFAMGHTTLLGHVLFHSSPRRSLLCWDLSRNTLLQTLPQKLITPSLELTI